MVRQPPFKVGHEYPSFSQRIQGDIRRPIHPPSGSFHYFYKFDWCIYTMDASLFVVHKQHYICEINCSNYKIKGTISILSNQDNACK